MTDDKLKPTEEHAYHATQISKQADTLKEAAQHMVDAWAKSDADEMEAAEANLRAALAGEPFVYETAGGAQVSNNRELAEIVQGWENDWLCSQEWTSWGDTIEWSTAKEIAKRLDAMRRAPDVQVNKLVSSLERISAGRLAQPAHEDVGCLCCLCAETVGNLRKTAREALDGYREANDMIESNRQKYITVWRKPDNVLEWDFHTSEESLELERIVANLKKQGVHQFGTYPIGERVKEFSSEY